MRSFFELVRPLSFRGKVRLLSLLCRRKGTVTANVFGYSVTLDLVNYVDRMVYFGCYEPMNTFLFKRILKPGMTVVDVGANIGYFTLLAARAVGSRGRVIAIEPHPANFSLLKHTIETNRIPNVVLLPIALGDQRDRIHIGMANQDMFPNRTASTLKASAEDPEVYVDTLDELMEREGLQTVDLLKVDVDGYESRILRGAQRALGASRIKNIIIEFSPYWLKESGTTAGALQGLLEGYGFKDLSGQFALAKLFLGVTDDRYFGLPA